MTRPPPTGAALESYRNETPYPFCPGCGHGPILDALDAALVELEIDPGKVVLVSDIGCSGLSDQYFRASAFHGLHGRSVTYASGIALARPDLTVVVLMGDGGVGIGGHHLLAAARRNLGMTVLVFNNFNFGMTGGQHSATTPLDAVTASTPAGNLERPLDVCATVAANGASFVYRGTSFDRDLGARIAEAIRHPGFALLDVWELCTAYFMPRNRWSRRSLGEAMERLGFATGQVRKAQVTPYSVASRRRAAELSAGKSPAPVAMRPRFTSSLDRRFTLVLAGAAGGHVGSAARLVARAAVLSGLWAAQRNDYPVTVKTGYSIAELVLSPRPIEYTGVEAPDALAIVSPEGRARSARYLKRMGSAARVFALADLADVVTAAEVTRLETGEPRAPRGTESLAVLAAAVEALKLFPQQALEAAVELEPASRREELAKSLAAGGSLRLLPTGLAAAPSSNR